MITIELMRGTQHQPWIWLEWVFAAQNAAVESETLVATGDSGPDLIPFHDHVVITRIDRSPFH